MKKKINIKDNYALLLVSLLVIVLAVFTILKPDTLWKVSTWKSMASQFPEYGVMTLGVMLCFIAGCIDVSFVSLGNFASIIASLFMLQAAEGTIPEGQTGLIVILAILIAMVVGGISGYLNGNLISRLGIPPILATLSTQLVFRGLAIALTQGYAVTGIPPIYSEVGHMDIFGFLPVPLLVFIIVLLFVAFLLKYTTFGKKLYMIGSNPKAARFSGINVTKMINTTFVINGMIAAIGALLMVSTMNSAKADYGSSYLMRCILILVLAGVLPDGGMGKIFNVLIAIVTIQIIATSVNMFPELNSYYGSLISAIMLIVMLMITSRLLSTDRKVRRKKKNLPKEAG